MDLGWLTQIAGSFFRQKCKKDQPQYQLLPPVVEYRSLVREGLSGFVIEDPVVAEDSEFFQPPSDCAPSRPQVPVARPASPERVLSLRTKGEDALELGDLLQNPQELLLGLLCFIDEEIASHLAQVEYSASVALPEAPPSPALLSRLARARVSSRNQERVLVAAPVFFR